MSEVLYWAAEVLLLGGSLRSRRWAMMVMALSLPLSRRLPALPVPFLNYQSLLFAAVLLSFAIHPAEKKAPGGPVHFGIPLAIMGLLLTASYVTTLVTFTPVKFWRLWDPYRNAFMFRAAIFCLLCYVLASLGVRTREDLLGVLRAGAAGVILESLYGLAEAILRRPSRLTGHMVEPNNMGCYVATGLVLLLALALVLKWRHPVGKAAIVGMACAFPVLLGTLSRGAWLGAGAGFVLLGALLNRKVLAAGMVVLALNVLWLPENVRARLAETFTSEEENNWRLRDGKGAEASALIAMINEQLEEEAAIGEIEEGQTRLDPSLQARLIVWTIAAQMIQDYPFGVGFGVFPWHVQFYSDVIQFKATHNIYLKLATESGIPALLVFLFLIGAFAVRSIRIARAAPDPEVGAFAWGMLGYLATLSVCALSVDVFFQIEVNGQYWLMMGALLQAPSVWAATGASAPKVAAGSAWDRSPDGVLPPPEPLRGRNGA